MRKLVIEVMDADADAILEWANTPHRIFITSSVPRRHMWCVNSIIEMDGHTTSDGEKYYGPGSPL